MTLDHKRQQGGLYMVFCLTFCVDATLNINIAADFFGFVSYGSRPPRRQIGTRGAH